ATAAWRCRTSGDRRRARAGACPGCRPAGPGYRRRGIVSWSNSSSKKVPVRTRPDRCARSVAARMGMVVDGLGVLQHRILDGPGRLCAGQVQAPVEAALAPGVAGDAADLGDLEQQHVAVAVQADVVDLLDVAGFLALAPQAPARTREIHGAAGA